jgi:hypothetical protein
MAVAIQVPFNTMLADLDQALAALLRTELAEHGFNGVGISFDAPTREWSAGVSTPTLNLFLYDLREAANAPAGDWTERKTNGRALMERPPLAIDCAYSITAWTRAVQDEHRMLSQALAVLLAHERLPDSALGDGLAARPGAVMTRIGRPNAERRAEFWTALGGQYKLALDYVVTLSVDPGVTMERGPEVRTQTVRVVDRDPAAGRTVELQRVGGVVRRADGEPAAGAWIALPEAGALATVGGDGRFSFANVAPGRHRWECRTPDGAVASGELTVPGEVIELTLEPGS